VHLKKISPYSVEIFFTYKTTQKVTPALSKCKSAEVGLINKNPLLAPA